MGFASSGRTQGARTTSVSALINYAGIEAYPVGENSHFGRRLLRDVGHKWKREGGSGRERQDETKDLPGYFPPLKGCPNVIIAPVGGGVRAMARGWGETQGKDSGA